MLSFKYLKCYKISLTNAIWNLLRLPLLGRHALHREIGEVSSAELVAIGTFVSGQG